MDSSPPPNQLHTIQQRITVPYSYPVHFTQDVFSPANPLLGEFFSTLSNASPRRVMAILDDGLVQHWPELPASIEAASKRQDSWSLAAAPHILPGGELVKNDPSLISELYERFQKLGLDRHSCIMAIGGGALLDAVGYAAATAHRGIRLLRLPTTVLSQNDAGVGVKNGINALGSKNFLGTFAPPVAVINDLEFLTTLSERDRRAGMSEAVKVALIKDPDFFEWLCKHATDLAKGEKIALRHLVIETARLHLRHIAEGGDPFEMGQARPLDFGHWAAHKLESITKHRLCHGEAVAIGIALDTQYAVECGLLAPKLAARVLGLLSSLGLPTYDSAMELMDPSGAPVLLQGLEEFRQHLGGELCVTQLREVGDSIQVNQMDPSDILAARDHLKALDT